MSELVTAEQGVEAVDRAVVDLLGAKACWHNTSLARRVSLLEACVVAVRGAAEHWVDLSCQAKGIEPGSPTRSEEIAGGPLATLRCLQLLAQSLRDVDRVGRPQLPGQPSTDSDGRLRVPLCPVRQLYDGVIFSGFTCEAWIEAGVDREELYRRQQRASDPRRQPPAVVTVLGAGNVSSIAVTDALGFIFQRGAVVLLKLNPVNDYLASVFAEALAPLIEAGCLRIVRGAAEVGQRAVGHADVDAVHVTGSADTHDAIVWGPQGEERRRRLAENDPLLTKPITSELGNVTPWIVVPGEYSERELQFQAENVAAMIANNASFNCIAAKMIVTWRRWPQRERFLDLIEETLAGVPRRRAYYPGAADRFEAYSGRTLNDDERDRLPWTLIRDTAPESAPRLFGEESFVCVSAETAVEAANDSEYLQRAVELANDQLWGTLGVGLMVHPNWRRSGDNQQRLDEAIARLRYGAVAINQWPGLVFALMSPPWGGHPGGTLAEPQSGVGWVHNTYFLEGVEKSLLEGPLVVWPKPLWLPTHHTAEVLAWRVVDLYARPSMWKLPGIVLAALRG
ncbi:MAG: aldehyde dehydrogenase family protein [Pirellulales bacterium]